VIPNAVSVRCAARALGLVVSSPEWILVPGAGERRMDCGRLVIDLRDRRRDDVGGDA